MLEFGSGGVLLLSFTGQLQTKNSGVNLLICMQLFVLMHSAFCWLLDPL